MTDDPRPPAHVEPIVRALGMDAAVEFLLAFGGSDLTLPRRPQAGSRLVMVLGPTKAAALCEAAHAAYAWPRRVPLAKPWLARVLHARGLPVAEIARRLHVADNTVRRNLAMTEGGDPRDATDPRQFRLF